MGHRTARRRLLVVVALTTGLLLGGVGVAHADEEEPHQSNVLVLEAIALITNKAAPATITARLEDALTAPDKSGTDLTRVRQARSLVDRGDQADLNRARQLLLGATNVRFATGYGAVPAPGQAGTDRPPYATGAETGTTAVLDEFTPRRGISDTGDVVLLSIAVLAVAVGMLLAHRWRPHDTLRALRHRLTPPGEA